MTFVPQKRENIMAQLERMSTHTCMLAVPLHSKDKITEKAGWSCMSGYDLAYFDGLNCTCCAIQTDS